jgi:diguanylate cyclase (GGDEF)-like protein
VGKAKILVVDDEPRTRDAMKDLLEDEGYDVRAARDGADALAQVDAFEPDLVLSDVCMPGTDGLELTRRLRASTRVADTALILISAIHDRDRRVLALDVGADDFLDKPVDPNELLARVRAHLRRARRHSDVLRLSVVDQLTSVLNRRGLFETLEREIVKATASGTPLSVLVVDLDDFKNVNDTFGHAAGDEVLKRAAALLKSSVREQDSVGRVGGDEMVVVLACSDAWDAAAVAARIRSVEGPGSARVTLSVGAATLHAGETADELLARADANMYEEKAASKRRDRRSPTPTSSVYIQVHDRKER